MWGVYSLVQAGCDGLPVKLNAELNYGKNTMSKELRFSSCKVWPFDSSKTIVALVHFQDGSSFEGAANTTDGLYDLTLLLVESRSGKVLTRYFQKSVFTSDAIIFNGVAIDTAPYNLTNNIRAFGVKAQFSNLSALNKIEYDQLNLYVNNGGSIQNVLSNLEIAKHLIEVGDHDCVSTFLINRTIAISNTSTKGYADLSINEKKTDDVSKSKNDECKETQKINTKKYMMHFNGENYNLPDEIKSINGV